MEATIPNTANVFKALIRADFTTQWRNRRSVILIVIVPVIILMSWRELIPTPMSGEFALSSVITVGLMAIGLMGYSNAIARDRDKGVFQRLRVAPIHSGAIMLSRLMVSLALILVVTVGCFVVGYFVDNIHLSLTGYILTFFAAFIGGAVYLGLGQAIVGLITNPETVNSTTRLVYFIFIMVGMLGEFGQLGEKIQEIIHWSPYGCVRIILSNCLSANLTKSTGAAFFCTIGYAVVFIFIGIRNFKWSTK